MNGFIKNNWFLGFLVIFFLMLALFSTLGILLNDDIEGFFWGKTDDKRLDVMSSVILASVSFASALVTIILAKTALLYAENEQKREFKNRIEERIKSIQDINNEIINSVKELRVIAYKIMLDLDFKVNDYLNKGNNDFEMLKENMEKEFEKLKRPLTNFAIAIRKLNSNTLVFQHYKKNFINDKNDAINVHDIAIEMENIYIPEMDSRGIFNHISEILKKIKDFPENRQKWIVFSLIFRYSIKLSQTNKSIDSDKDVIFDILLNLPNCQSYKEISKKFDKEFWETNKKYAEETINILSEEGDNEKEFNKELKDIKNWLTSNATFLDSNSNRGYLDFLLKIAKGVAIEHKQKEINSNVIFTTLSYLELNSYAKAVLSKMMGEHFYRIKPSIGGQKYIDLVDDYKGKDIPFDSNMEIFIKEARKHLDNENFCSLR